MSEELLDLIKTGIPVILSIVLALLFARFRDPLKRLKDLSKNPIISILASAAVLIAEAYWSRYGGEVQFEQACEWLAAWLGVPVDQVRDIVQGAYEALKAILGENWGALKLGLAPGITDLP